MPVAESWALASMKQAEGGAASLDMASMLLTAYEIGDMINQSAEVADYLYWKSVVEANGEVKALQLQFAKAKELFAECERFGRFHPDFHDARKKVKAIEKLIAEIECVQRYKLAEGAVDEMLHEVSLTIAESVSELIKVPGNEKGAGGGCGSGGSCGCGSGGCG